MKQLKDRVYALYRIMGKDVLDLHVLFEAGGNDPEERQRVLDAVQELVSEGFVEPRGNDFYALTEKGKRVAGF